MRWGAGSFRTSENKIRSLSSVRLLRHLSQLSEREHTLWLMWLMEYFFVASCVQRAWVCRIRSGLFFWRLAYCGKVRAKNTTALTIIFCKYDSSKVQRKALRWRFFTPSAGLDLASIQGNRHTFARPNMASGLWGKFTYKGSDCVLSCCAIDSQ